MECDSVDDRDQEEGPVRAALCLGDVATVVDGEEDMCCATEIRECLAQSPGIGRLKDHERHARSEKDDVRGFIFTQELVFEVSGQSRFSALCDFCG